jgi:hypothetical protein
MIGLIFNNMLHDAKNQNMKLMHAKFKSYDRTALTKRKTPTSAKRRAAVRFTTDDGDDSDLSDDDDGEPFKDDETDDDSHFENMEAVKGLREIKKLILGEDNLNDNQALNETLRCIECESSHHDQTRSKSCGTKAKRPWLCPGCRRVGVGIEIVLPLKPSHAVIQRLYRNGHAADIRFDNGQVEHCCLDEFCWYVVEKSFDQRFINLSSLFVQDPTNPLVEHTHQDDFIHFCSILQHLTVEPDSKRLQSDPIHEQVQSEPPQATHENVRIAIGVNNHAQHFSNDDHDAVVHLPQYIDSQNIMCGIAFNSMMGSYTSGRQLPLYQYARLFHERLFIWRTIARVADSAPNTNFEKEFSSRIVPVYKLAFAKPDRLCGITRQKFKILGRDDHESPVLEWTYLIRHDPRARCKNEDPIKHSRVMINNRDSCSVIVESLSLFGVILWNFDRSLQQTAQLAPSSRAKATPARAKAAPVKASSVRAKAAPAKDLLETGSDHSLGIHVRYIWKNFTDESFISHLHSTLENFFWKDRRYTPHTDKPNLMLFAILLIKSLGDLGSACTIRWMNDRMNVAYISMLRPSLFYNFVWTFDRHISWLCSIITNGHVLFTPSVPSDNGLSIHGMFFGQGGWFERICSVYRLDLGGREFKGAMEQVVIRMLFYISAHVRRNISFTACQDKLLLCLVSHSSVN